MSRSLKVLQISHGFPPAEQAGAELCCLYQSRELRRRGHQVSVFTRTEREGAKKFELVRDEVDGVPVARLAFPADTARSLRDTYQSDFVGDCLRKELEAGVDVVHIHHLFGLSTDLVEVAKSCGARVVLTLHDFWYLCPRGQRYTPRGHLCTEIEPWRCSLCIAKKRVRYALNAFGHKPRDPDSTRWSGTLRSPVSAVGGALAYGVRNLHTRPILDRSRFILDQLSRADLCLSPSRFVLDEYLRAGLSGPETAVSPNGIDPGLAAKLSPRAAPHRPLQFGFMGTFLPSKGVDLLVEAFQDIPEGNAELHLHGTSLWDGGAFASEVERSNRHPGVHFHGTFDHDELPRVLAEIDVLVVPSRWFENAPVTLDEAALAEIPVIVADHGGMRESLELRGNGLGFRPGIAADLTRAIRRMIDQEELWQNLRRPRVPVRTVADQADELERRYHALLDGGLDP